MDSQLKHGLSEQIEPTVSISAPARRTISPNARSAAKRERTPGIASLLSDLKLLIKYSSVIGASFLPESMAYGIARRIGRAQYRRRQTAAVPLMKEMSARLGTSEQEAEKSVQRLFELSAWRDLELWRTPRSDKRELEQLVDFRGLNHLDEALRRGKGAILCTGHLRSLITFFVALGRRGYKMNAVRRDSLKIQGPIGRWLVKKRTLIGSDNVNFFWMNSSSLKAAVQVGNALRRNEIVVFLIDVRYGAETVPVDFLGEKKMLPSGHVMLAQATGAPLIDFFMHHPDDSNRQIVEFEEPYYPSGDLVAGVQHGFSALESKIMQYPADWIWFSERELWKNPSD